jgi:hypothetical protein
MRQRDRRINARCDPTPREILGKACATSPGMPSKGTMTSSSTGIFCLTRLELRGGAGGAD